MLVVTSSRSAHVVYTIIIVIIISNGNRMAVAIIHLLSTFYGLCSLQLISNSQSNHVKSVLAPYFFNKDCKT